MDELLIPLRIPAGWTIVTNAFYNLLPVVEHGIFINRHLFSESLLSVEQMYIPESRAPRFFLDLGWYPSEDPQGAYRLTLLHGSWDDIACTAESRSSLDIRKFIDLWLDVASQCMTSEEVKLHLYGDLERPKGNPMLRKAVEQVLSRPPRER